MSTKRQIIAALEGIPDDEPLFLLRAQDCLADGIVREWADRARILRVNLSKIKHAHICADKMAAWPVRKTPD